MAVWYTHRKTYTAVSVSTGQGAVAVLCSASGKVSVGMGMRSAWERFDGFGEIIVDRGL